MIGEQQKEAPRLPKAPCLISADGMHETTHTQTAGLPSGQQSSQGIAIPFKSTACSSGTMALCGCRCGGCTCLSCSNRGLVSMPDPNREAYGGQGTSVDALSNHFSSLNASSFEAPVPKNDIAPPSVELLSKLNEYTPTQLAETRTEKYLDDIDDAPWRHFVSERSMTSDATEMSGMFFGPIDLESSVENNPGSSGSRSMLSSHMSVRSESASAAIKHAGAALSPTRSAPSDRGDPFLEVL